MLMRFFRPKWQHRDAGVRLEAVRALPIGDRVLSEVVLNDADAQVRRQAVRQLNDISLLEQLLSSDGDNEIRALALKRLGGWLAGYEADSPALEQRIRLIDKCAQPAVAEYLLRHGDDVALRQRALERVERQALLGDIALEDASGELRVAALERINQGSTLERVAKQARGKDKRIARIARERLDAMRLAEERPRRLLEICDQIAALADAGGLDITGYRRLLNEWQTLLGGDTDTETARRFEAGCAAFDKAHEAYRMAVEFSARQRELCERAEQLLVELSADALDLGGIETAIAMLEDGWRQVEQEPGEVSDALAVRFREAARQLRARLGQRIEEQVERERLHQLLADLEQLAGDEEGLSEGGLHSIERHWQEATRGGRKNSHTAAAHDRYHGLMEKARQRLLSRRAEQQALHEELNRCLDDLQSALEQGKLQQAISAHDKARVRLERLALLGENNQRQQKRLQQLAGRMRELRDWRRFGTNCARDELLAQAQSLLSVEQDPLRLLESIRKLREDWRELDRKDGVAPQALWEDFDQALAAAHEPVKAHFDRQSEIHEAHRREREAFLDALQQFYEAIDWESPDWGAIDKRARQAQNHWTRMGGVDAAGWKPLNQRFRGLFKLLDERLEKERARDIKRREGLIALVERLQNEHDLKQALAQVKEAQASWKPSVSVQRKIEQALWQRFNEACQRVYARRNEQAQQRRSEENALFGQRQALCARLAELLNQPSALEVEGEVEALVQQWQALDKGRGKAFAQVEKQFDGSVRDYRRACADELKRQQAVQLELMAEKGRLCDEVGTRTQQGEPQSDEIAARWQAMPPLDDSALEQRMQQRFTASAVGVDAQVLVENTAQRGEWLLTLEWLSGVDSPAELADARMALQVARLQEEMKKSSADTERSAEIAQLLKACVTTGPIAADKVESFHQRMQVIVKAVAGREV